LKLSLRSPPAFRAGDLGAELMMGMGSFLVLASVISQRLYVVPALPPALLPTIAIEVAPPAVAGNSWSPSMAAGWTYPWPSWPVLRR
jgi:hypothetical protein